MFSARVTRIGRILLVLASLASPASPMVRATSDSTSSTSSTSLATSLQLVSPANASSSKLTANPGALEYLRSLPKDQIVFPTTIIGPYRTGKSFTLNQIMDGTLTLTSPTCEATTTRSSTGFSPNSNRLFPQQQQAFPPLTTFQLISPISSVSPYSTVLFGFRRRAHAADADEGHLDMEDRRGV